MRIRLIADDLTGAMDTAVRLVPLTGAIPVLWRSVEDAASEAGSLAYNLATRELDGARARQRAAEAVSLLAGADIAYLKCDSLLRGSAAEEIAGCLEAGAFDHCVVAPAFPAQRRLTRQWRQWAASLGGEDWRLVGPDLGDQLMALGLTVSKGRPGEDAPGGVSLWDAETDVDLQRIVLAARALPGRVLWCGTAGLAQALAGAPPPHVGAVRAPLLALVGSDHPVTARQLAEVAEWHFVLKLQNPQSSDTLADRLMARGAAVVSVAVPETTDRKGAAERIAEAFKGITSAVPQPATLFATGGETLRGICDALGATVLTVDGEVGTGIPVSRMRDGRWAGTTVISKSGAFGDPALLRRLISSAC